MFKPSAVPPSEWQWLPKRGPSKPKPQSHGLEWLHQPQGVVENIKKEQVVDHKRAFCRVEEVPPTQKQSARSSSPRPTGFDVVVEDEYELTETDSQSGELHGVFVVDCVQLSSNVFRLS